jgi:hypothetical protein
MQSNKKKKLTKRLWLRQDKMLLALLVFSMALAVTIVSCKKDFLNPPAPETTNAINSNNGSIHGTEDLGVTAAFIFKEIGTGVLRKVGDAGMGWLLGTIGLATQGGASSAETAVELGKISTELTEIQSQLIQMNGKLDTMAFEIEVQTCANAIMNLDADITWITSLMEDYHTALNAAVAGVAVSETFRQHLVHNIVYGGDNGSSEKDIKTILVAFQTQLYGAPQNIMKLCLKPGVIPLPEAGFGTDVAHYNEVSRFVNYYYGFYVNALLLHNEANNYMAYDTAYQYNLIDSTHTTVSMATICSLGSQNSDIWTYCDQNNSKLETAYTDMTTIFTIGGAPYTNDYQILNYGSSSQTLWVRSLEKFNTDVGANCPDPMTMTKNGVPCGPTNGYYFTPLANPTFRQLNGWTFAKTADLQTLFPSPWFTSPTTGTYLESLGFENLVGTDKVVQATDPKEINIRILNHEECSTCGTLISTENVIPFFYVDHQSTAGLWESEADFNYLLQPSEQPSYYWCENTYHAPCHTYVFHGPASLTDNSSWTKSFWFHGIGIVGLANNGYIDLPFKWSDAYSRPASNDYYPGWKKLKQDNKWIDAYAFMWPINHTANANCTVPMLSTGLTKHGMVTMCGDDFTAWLDKMVPPLQQTQ